MAPTKQNPKNGEFPHHLPALLTEFTAMQIPTSQLQQVIKDNLGGQQLRVFDLERLHVPTGGGTAWQIETLEGSEMHLEIVGVIVS